MIGLSADLFSSVATTETLIIGGIEMEGSSKVLS